MEQYSGYLEKILFQKDGWLAGLFNVQDEQGKPVRLIKITGSFYKIVPGDQLTIWGNWQNHRQYGEQLAVDRYERPVPATVQALKSYLGSGLVKGVGPALAGRIVDHFGEEAINVAISEPDRLAAVRGISAEKAREISRAVEENLGFQQVVSFLLPYGVTARMALRIFRQMGSATIDRVKENPYVLTEVDLIGFTRADAIARSMGLDDGSPYRLQAGLIYTVKEAAEKEGHCYLPLDELVEKAQQKLKPGQISRTEVQDMVQAMAETGQMVCEDGRVYLWNYHRMEVLAAGRVQEFLAVPAGPDEADLGHLLDQYQARHRIRLADAQQEVVRKASTDGLVILTGGPGTGKTQTIRAVLEIYRRLREVKGMNCRIKLAAPTGRAARRMAEVTGFDAQTLHRLLGLKPGERASQAVRADLLVVDEFSMVDLPLFESLMKAVETGTKLLFVGDADQLPSVGPGNVLKDLLAAGVPSVHLTQVFRQAGTSQVVGNAHRINQGKTALETGQEFFFLQEEQPGNAVQAILQVVGHYLEAGGNLGDIQVLSPMKKGPLGTGALNNLLQQRFNPGPDPRREVRLDRWTTFRAGDKVIQLANNYQKAVFNGEIGTIREVVWDEDEPMVMVEFPDTGLVEYTEDELEFLSLAHAITVHKSQGSEYKMVVMPVTTHHYIMLARNLVYTAITRAREKVVLVGTRRALAMAVKNDKVARRYTALAGRISEQW